jgi:hypothetical protein
MLLLFVDIRLTLYSIWCEILINGKRVHVICWFDVGKTGELDIPEMR